jgi:putative FmdB family regulatory protein
MPTYEFRCPRGHEFEKFYRTISGAEAQAACPECGELSERMLSPTGFSFKGSGFYITDYGKDAHRENGHAHMSHPSDQGADGSGSPSSDAKGEPPPKSESSNGDGAERAAGSDSAKRAAGSDGAKSAGGSGSTSTSGTASAAPPAGTKPAAPKKSTGE